MFLHLGSPDQVKTVFRDTTREVCELLSYANDAAGGTPY